MRNLLILRCAIGIAAILLAGGCDDMLRPEIKDCEDSLIRQLRSPSTYKRIEARSTLMDTKTPPEVWAVIEYDAANAYGTPIRETEICKYPAKNGKADLDKYYEDLGSGPEAAAADALAAASEAEAAASEAAAEAASAAAAAVAEAHSEKLASSSLNSCWLDYCPCDTSDPDYGGMDVTLCRNLRGGLQVDDQLMSAGAASRDARRQLREFDEFN